MSPRHGCRWRGSERPRDPVGCAMYVGVTVVPHKLGREPLQKNPTRFARDLICSGHHIKQLILSKPKRRRATSHSDHLLLLPIEGTTPPPTDGQTRRGGYTSLGGREPLRAAPQRWRSRAATRSRRAVAGVVSNATVTARLDRARREPCKLRDLPRGHARSGKRAPEN